MGKQVNRRNAEDALLSVSKALPAADANNDTDSFNIGATGPHREGLKLRVDVPVNSVLVADKTVTLTLHDSADDSSFAAVADPGQTIEIVGATGFAAATYFFDVPAHARDYIRVNQAVLVGGGDNTATSFTYSLVS